MAEQKMSSCWRGRATSFDAAMSMTMVKARLSKPKVECDCQARRHDPAIVQAAVRKIQTHYKDQGFAPRPSGLRAILAVAALIRLSEKKRDGHGAMFAAPGREDAARTFLKAALEQFEAPDSFDAA
jgi:hypothetical protein